MNSPLPASRLPNGDLVIPAATAQILERALARFVREFDKVHGQQVTVVGGAESPEQTANRQASVNSLSEAIGVKAPTVADARLADTLRDVDHTEVTRLARELSRLLFPTP
ncbi:hypothetical protein JI739_02315 [Ramlibacter sp. AW1]|uniref:Uncharacterized protein n=1 Tax=Ramlibacter aurantiacus TaxID=2801330 RepID=A0A936ZMY4_9BURK|nr:hypothetical protein [Ramlibacter aurantiacus]MBL0419171.1 hypothetical protein [Ramlibacter aurantiacus]